MNDRYDHKIAFIGDSYCASTSLDHEDDSWLNIVLKEYNAEMLCKGRGGAALFYTFADLLKKTSHFSSSTIVDEADYIIFCITSSTRLPNRYAIAIDPTNLGGAKKPWDFKKLLGNNSKDGMHYTRGPNDVIDEKEPIHPRVLKRAVKAAELYYKDLMSLEFHQVAQKGLLMVIDELMIEKKKKCIWFPCFEDELSMQSYIPKSGPIANTNLSTISETEAEHNPDYYRLIQQGRDPRWNHLNEEHNKNLAQVIIDIIETNNFSPHEIKMEDYFEVLK